MDKHSSLLRTFENYRRNKFYDEGPGTLAQPTVTKKKKVLRLAPGWVGPDP
jgi:hypothetical protein